MAGAHGCIYHCTFPHCFSFPGKLPRPENQTHQSPEPLGPGRVERVLERQVSPHPSLWPTLLLTVRGVRGARLACADVGRRSSLSRLSAGSYSGSCPALGTSLQPPARLAVKLDYQGRVSQLLFNFRKIMFMSVSVWISTSPQHGERLGLQS